MPTGKRSKVKATARRLPRGAAKVSEQTIVRNSGEITVSVIVFIRKEDDCFVAYCPALELSSYGDTEAEAREAFDDAMKVFLTETVKRGTLEKFLLELGWSPKKLPRPSYDPPPLSARVLRAMRESTNVLTENVTIPI